jgi:hypothetical protein
MPEVDPNGVDLVQVRRMLALTPVERLRVLESALVSMMKVRDAAQRAEVPRDPASHLLGPGHILLETRFGDFDCLGAIDGSRSYELEKPPYPHQRPKPTATP